MTLHLSQSYLPDSGAEHGGFRFRLRNTGTEPVTLSKLCYASMTRLRDDVRVEGASVARKFANHVELVPDSPVTLEPGSVWEIVVDGLTHKPTNRTQGAMAAWGEGQNGAPYKTTAGDLQPPEGTPRGPLKDWPAGRVEMPLCLLPWPVELEVAEVTEGGLYRPAEGTDPAPFVTVTALHRRLFPADPSPFTLEEAPGAWPVQTETGDLPPEGYRLDFGETVTLTHADEAGLRHGLIALAQMAHAARTDARFRLPARGHIADHPRHAWRGSHLDVARNFMEAGRVSRFIDILAWHRMTHLHWHLSDDEGYRLPSERFPELSTMGATRGTEGALPPQYADGPGGQSGHYSREEVDALVAQASELGVTVIPEIDMPGHVTAILAAIPELRDPEEEVDSYRSVQGYPNNALNPALERTYEVVGHLLDELCEMFPGPVLHIGGDEVDHASWSRSPAAQRLAEEKGIDGAMGLQSHFLRRVQKMVHERGRIMGGWDECAEGGGIEPERTLLCAWQKVETTAKLMSEGYDVIATPGQAYYLDMVEAAGWDVAGTSWAGVSSPEHCYTFEASEGLPEGPGKLLGVQAGIWCEHINSTARFNAIVFPRLSAIAEAGWTPSERKDWPRFAALSHLMPQL